MEFRNSKCLYLLHTTGFWSPFSVSLACVLFPFWVCDFYLIALPVSTMEKISQVIYITEHIWGYFFSIHCTYYFSVICQNWYALRNGNQGQHIFSLCRYRWWGVVWRIWFHWLTRNLMKDKTALVWRFAQGGVVN